MTAEVGLYKVYVGLGNPGTKYEMTRHNIGFLVIKDFARKNGWSFKEEKKFNAFTSKGVIGKVTVHLLLPATYMNLSGLAVKHYMDFYKLEADALCIVSDDVALPFEQMRIKAEGSAGGHNGLKSIESHLGTSKYVRLRMGVGSPLQHQDLADYVLEKFNQSELPKLEAFISRGTQVLHSLLENPISKVMNAVNTKVDLT